MTARGVRICICVYCVCELLLEKPHLTGRCLDNLLRPPQFCERVACLSSSLRGWNWQVDFFFGVKQDGVEGVEGHNGKWKDKKRKYDSISCVTFQNIGNMVDFSNSYE